MDWYFIRKAEICHLDVGAQREMSNPTDNVFNKIEPTFDFINKGIDKIKVFS